MWIDTRGWTQKIAPLWWFESLIWGTSSRFPLANRFALPGSEPILGLSQGSPLCVHLLAKMDSSEEAYGLVNITY